MLVKLKPVVETKAQLSERLVAGMDAFIARQLPPGPERDRELRKLIDECLAGNRVLKTPD